MPIIRAFSSVTCALVVPLSPQVKALMLVQEDRVGPHTVLNQRDRPERIADQFEMIHAPALALRGIAEHLAK